MANNLLAEFIYYDSLEASPYRDAVFPVTGSLQVPLAPRLELGLIPALQIFEDHGARDVRVHSSPESG